MLDLSIKQLRSEYKSPEDLKYFMSEPSKVEHKTDGVKLTIIKIANEGTLDDWIVSYKGSILYRGEFDYQDALGKTLTLGNSQFDVVFDHLETLGHLSEIPLNTEFFCEFLVKKATVMSEYSATGQIILLGYGNASPVLRYGKVATNSQNLITKGREKYARLLRLNTPRILHQGVWFPTTKLVSGCVDPELRSIIAKSAKTLELLESNPLAYYNKVTELFLNLESQFGGKEEGLVIETPGGLYKIQQDYQLDKNARHSKKLRYREDDPQKEQAYWDDVIETGRVIAQEVLASGIQDIKQGLKNVSDRISGLNVDGAHSKKNTQSVKDDIQYNARNFLLKGLNGNDGALIIGKFRVLTDGHCKIIDKAIEESDDVVIGVVTGHRAGDINDLKLRMLRKTYPNVMILNLTTGNLFTAISKTGININKIYAGSDRARDYEKQLLEAPGVEVREIIRTGHDISATKIIRKMDDESFFKSNTPRQIHGMYREILETYRPAN